MRGLYQRTGARAKYPTSNTVNMLKIENFTRNSWDKGTILNRFQAKSETTKIRVGICNWLTEWDNNARLDNKTKTVYLQLTSVSQRPELRIRPDNVFEMKSMSNKAHWNLHESSHQNRWNQKNGRPNNLCETSFTAIFVPKSRNYTRWKNDDSM